MDEPGAPGTAASAHLLGCGRPSGPWLSVKLTGNGISSETRTCALGKQPSARGQGLTNWLPPSPWEARVRMCVRALRVCVFSPNSHQCVRHSTVPLSPHSLARWAAAR